MASYVLSKREIPLHDGYDVIVVGGGPAGCAAAIASAEQGAKTLLIESTGALGGMATSGLVPAWCPYSDGEKIIYRGISQKVFEALKAEMPHIKKEATNWLPISLSPRQMCIISPPIPCVKSSSLEAPISIDSIK